MMVLGIWMLSSTVHRGICFRISERVSRKDERERAQSEDKPYGCLVRAALRRRHNDLEGRPGIEPGKTRSAAERLTIQPTTHGRPTRSRTELPGIWSPRPAPAAGLYVETRTESPERTEDVELRRHDDGSRFGGPGRDRTDGLSGADRTLYQLSYAARSKVRPSYEGYAAAATS